MKKIIILMGLFLASHHSFAAPLHGEYRNIFIKSFNKSCMETQLNMPENEGLSISTLAEYCQCNAEEVSNTPNASSVLPAIGRGEMPLSSMTSVLNLTSKYCANKVFDL